MKKYFALAAGCMALFVLVGCNKAAEVVTASSFCGRIVAVDANVVTVEVAKLNAGVTQQDVEDALQNGKKLVYTGVDRTVTVQNLDLISDESQPDSRAGLSLLQVGDCVWLELITDENGQEDVTGLTVLTTEAQ